MLAELNDIGSGDAAALWAKRRFPDKNKLNAADAKHIETVFRTKLLSFAAHHADGIPGGGGGETQQAGQVAAGNSGAGADCSRCFSNLQDWGRFRAGANGRDE